MKMTQWHKGRQHWDTEPSHRFHHQETHTSNTGKKTIYYVYSCEVALMYQWTRASAMTQGRLRPFTWVFWKARKELVLETTVENPLEV